MAIFNDQTSGSSNWKTNCLALVKLGVYLAALILRLMSSNCPHQAEDEEPAAGGGTAAAAAAAGASPAAKETSPGLTLDILPPCFSGDGEDDSGLLAAAELEGGGG